MPHASPAENASYSPPSVRTELRAVSDALDEKLEPEVVFDPDFDGYIHRYDKDEVDALLARIRAILSGS